MVYNKRILDVLNFGHSVKVSIYKVMKYVSLNISFLNFMRNLHKFCLNKGIYAQLKSNLLALKKDKKINTDMRAQLENNAALIIF